MLLDSVGFRDTHLHPSNHVPNWHTENAVMLPVQPTVQSGCYTNLLQLSRLAIWYDTVLNLKI
eukprot:5348135-Amphidinium_carterae.1